MSISTVDPHRLMDLGATTCHFDAARDASSPLDRSQVRPREGPFRLWRGESLQDEFAPQGAQGGPQMGSSKRSSLVSVGGTQRMYLGTSLGLRAYALIFPALAVAVTVTHGKWIGESLLGVLGPVLWFLGQRRYLVVRDIAGPDVSLTIGRSCSASVTVLRSEISAVTYEPRFRGSRIRMLSISTSDGRRIWGPAIQGGLPTRPGSDHTIDMPAGPAARWFSVSYNLHILERRSGLRVILR